MTTLFPAQIDNANTLPAAVDNLTPVTASVFNNLRDAILAIEGELGVKPSATYGTVRARLDAIQASITNLTGVVFAGDLTGISTSQTVVGIQGRPVSSVGPSINQVLGWSGAAWAPINQTGGTTVTFNGDLSGTPSSQTVIGLRNILISSSVPTSGQTLIYNGTQWVPSTNFGAQTVQTTGQLISGPALSTSSTTSLIQLNGKFVTNSIVAPALSASGQGIIYFDATAQEFLVSQSGSNYYPLVLNNTSTNFTTSGQISGGTVVSTTATTTNEIINGELIVNGATGISVSGAGQGVIYFDSSQNKFLVSENGGNFIPLTETTVNLTVVTTNYNASNTDQVIAVGTLSLPITINLPAAPPTGKTITIKDAHNSAATYNITVSGNGNNIDGSLTYVMSINYESITVIYDGFGWGVI